jgi:hypothetical protein
MPLKRVLRKTAGLKLTPCSNALSLCGQARAGFENIPGKRRQLALLAMTVG